jgi:iron complex outermembrane receptor protein
VGHTLLGGLDYQHLRDRYTFSSGLASPLNYRDPDYDLPVGEAVPYLSTRSLTETYGAYLQDQLKLGGFILTLGARHDWARQTTDDLLVENGDTQEQTDHEWTYRAGLSYVTPFGLAPYVSYATSFLPTSGTDIEGNQFEPTEGRQYEIGLKYKPTWFNGFFAVAAYDLVKENVLSADPDNGPFAQTQVGEIRSRGIEVEAHASLMAGLDLTMAYAYNDPEVTKDNPDATGVSAEGNDPTLAPRHLASAWLDYTFQGTFLRGLLLGGGARYVGSTYADPQNELENDDYLLFDAAARYDFGNIHEPLRGASLALNANNLLDEDYTTCFSVFDCNWGVGRTVIATLSYRW